MSEQAVGQMRFGFSSGLPVVVEPVDAQLSSDVGILPIREFDDQIGYTERLAACLNEPRNPDQIDHPVDEMVRQRLYGILAGYEDGNDHTTLRGDPVFKIVSGRAPNEGDLASQPTLSRFENGIDIGSLWRVHDFFLDDFLRSFDRPPASIPLDIDAMDDPCHGRQQLALFHGFYDQYPYLPLVIRCAETKQILWVSLRPGNVHAALGADDDIEYVVGRIRAAWPGVMIHVRGDAGFGVPWMYAVCERLELFYTFGLPANAVLKEATDFLLEQAVAAYERTGEPQRLFTPWLYRAGSWKDFRRVIVKVECHRVGTNRRFLVTNRPGAAVLPGAAYDEYAERGESENRNKELKEGVSADRLSCHRFVANYFRLQMHAGALNLLIRLRAVVSDPPRLVAQGDPILQGRPSEERANFVPVDDPSVPVAALAEPERRRYRNGRRRKDPLGEGHLATWRTCLIKVAGEVFSSTRRIVIRIPTYWPHLRWFRDVWRRLTELRRRAQVQT